MSPESATTTVCFFNWSSADMTVFFCGGWDIAWQSVIKLQFHLTAVQPDSPLRKEIGIFRALRRIEQNRSKQGGKDQESIQSSTPPEPGYHMGKWQKHN